MTQVLAILDTNIFIHQPEILRLITVEEVAISIEVLRELDSLKSRPGSVSYSARSAIRNLKEVLTDENKVGQNCFTLPKPSIAKLRILGESCLNDTERECQGDERILRDILAYSEKNTDSELCLFSHDILFQMQARMAGVKVASESELSALGGEIEGEHVDSDGLIELGGEFWDNALDICVGSQRSYRMYVPEGNTNHFYPGLFLKHDAHLYRVTSYDPDTHQITFDVIYKQIVSGVEPRDERQICAVNALMSPDIGLVGITGAAGCGKTHLAMSCALELVINQQEFDDIVVLRNKPSIVEEDGFLPGDEVDKILPFMAGVSDAVEELGHDVSRLIDDGILHVRSINSIRGASWKNRIVIIEEGQNLTRKAIKAIITRLGEGSKVIITGNINSSQIDATNVSAESNGLTRVLEVFMDHEEASHIQLQNMYRTDIAAHAERYL